MINQHERIEAQAWGWLLSLPRLPWQEHDAELLNNQIVLKVVPGELGANQGAPMVQLTYVHPVLPDEPFMDVGNNLAEACGHVHSAMLDKRLAVNPIPAEVGLAF